MKNKGSNLSRGKAYGGGGGGGQVIFNAGTLCSASDILVWHIGIDGIFGELGYFLS